MFIRILSLVRTVDVLAEFTANIIRIILLLKRIIANFCSDFLNLFKSHLPEYSTVNTELISVNTAVVQEKLDIL